MRALRFFFMNPVLTAVFSFCLLSIGGLGLFDRPSERRVVEHLARLRPADGVQPGGAAYLEGRIAPEQEARRGRLVAWVREEYRSCGRGSCWTMADGEAPPLRVVAANGTAWSVAGGYALAETADTVAEAEPGWTRGSVRSRGFAAGRAVLLVGHVAPDGGFAADEVYAGGRAELLARQRRGLDRTGVWFGAMTAAGLVLLGIAVWQWRRFLREVAADRAREAAAAAAAEAARPPRRQKTRRGR